MDQHADRPAAGTLLPGFVGTTLPGWLADRLRAGLAGVCLFGPNILSLSQLRELTDEIRAANPLALIAIDEEGGDVTRLFDRVGSPYPGNAILGRIDDLALTERVARSVGEQLRRVGVNLDFAPDVDVNSNPDNPVIGVRSFGADAGLVARHSAAWVHGLEETGVAASAKHFPGHGDTAQDSHLALPVIDGTLDELRVRELLPFMAAIAAGTSTIMTSHIVVPELDRSFPATFSSAILQRLLRTELGFDGVIVSDALDMVGASGEIGIPEAAVRALIAGCDLLCIGTENTDAELEAIEAAVTAALQSGRLSGTRLDEASGRTAALAAKVRVDAIPNGEYIEPSFDSAPTGSAFDVKPGVTIRTDRRVLILETEANIAVGQSLWGPAAAGAGVTVVREGDAVAVEDGIQAILVGRANHLHGWIRGLVDALRVSSDVVVVDMGWPSDDRRYADIATFGASRHVAAALLEHLDRAAAS